MTDCKTAADPGSIAYIWNRTASRAPRIVVCRLGGQFSENDDWLPLDGWKALKAKWIGAVRPLLAAAPPKVPALTNSRVAPAIVRSRRIFGLDKWPAITGPEPGNNEFSERRYKTRKEAVHHVPSNDRAA